MSKIKKPTISQTDCDLFRQSVQDAVPLNNNDRYYTTHRPTKKATPGALAIDRRANPPSMSDTEVLETVTANQPLQFAQPGVQNKTQKKLRLGQIPIDATIDLHGLTVEQSNLKLANFIQICLSNAWRCVIVIHGRGIRSPANYPVLKNHVYHWLRHNPNVIALSSAVNKDGGLGALYVLLKRQ